MRVEFLRCFIAYGCGKDADAAICNEDAFYVRKKLEEFQKDAEELWEKMISYKLFSYYGYEENKGNEVMPVTQMITLLGRWNEPGIAAYIERSYDCVEIREVIFWTVFLIKNKICQDSGERVLKDLLESMDSDYHPDRCEDVPGIILYYILKYNKSLEIWRDLLESWEGKKSKLSGEDVVETKVEEGTTGEETEEEKIEKAILRLKFEGGVKDFNYINLKKFVDSGLSDVDKKTRNSIRAIDDFIKRYITDKGDSTDISEVFDMGVLTHVSNCQKRRKWYMFRLMERVIKYQIDEFLAGIEEYQQIREKISALWMESAGEMIEYFAEKQREYTKENVDPRLFKVSLHHTWEDLDKNHGLISEMDIKALIYSLEKNIWYSDLPNEIRKVVQTLIEWYDQWGNLHMRLRKMEKGLWIKKGGNDYEYYSKWYSWNKLCESSKNLLNVNVKELRSDLENSRIVPGRINDAFNTYFDGVWMEKGNAMAKLEIRCYEYWEKGIELNGYDGRMYEESDSSGINRHGLEKIRYLILGKKEVTREMLLLMGLLHKAVIGKDTDLVYLQRSVLFHSRLSREFRNTRYEQYVMNAYNAMNGIESRQERISVLQHFSREMEEAYLRESDEKRRMAVFSSIMSGRRIER